MNLLADALLVLALIMLVIIAQALRDYICLRRLQEHERPPTLMAPRGILHPRNSVAERNRARRALGLPIETSRLVESARPSPPAPRGLLHPRDRALLEELSERGSDA